MIDCKRDIRRSPFFYPKKLGWVCIEQVQDYHMEIPRLRMEYYLSNRLVSIFLRKKAVGMYALLAFFLFLERELTS